MSRDEFVAGQWNFVCDECGRYGKSGDARKTWQGFWVHRRCWDPRHPQDFVKGRTERPVPPWVRPPVDPFPLPPPRLPGRNGLEAALPRVQQVQRLHNLSGGESWPVPLVILAIDPFLYLLLHGNGSEGNNLVDVSPNEHTPTGGAGLIISASPDAWGASAIEVNGGLGSPDYREYTLPFAAENQAFTFEYFLQIISSEGAGDGYAEGRQEVLRLTGTSGFLHTSNCAIGGTGGHLVTAPAAVFCDHATFGISDITQRVHICYQRGAGSQAQLFLEGRYVSEGGITSTDAITSLRIGNPGISSRAARAWIDAVRFLRGTKLYPSRVLESQGDLIFTPPTTIFTPNEV